MATTNPIEMERKFLITDDTLKYMRQSLSIKFNKIISQNYLFPENTNELYFDIESKEWVFNLFSNTVTQKILYTFKIRQIDNVDVAIDVLKDFNKINIINDKSFVSRFRLSNSDVIFTCKYKNPFGLGDFEFEVVLSGQEKKFALHFMNSDLFKISKNRTGFLSLLQFDKQDLIYEVDSFSSKNNRFVMLEVEFNSEENYKSFIPDFDFIKEVTNDIEFKNNFMAYNNGLSDTF